METRTYTERSNARRAAKAAGIDPALVFETDDGFTFPAPESQDPEPEASPNGHNGHLEEAGDHAAEATHNDGMPDALKLSPEQRKAAWDMNPAKPATPPKEATEMPKTAKRTKQQPRGQKGNDKTALLIGMLRGKGATVDALTQATGWLPHTLRARISGVAKPKSKGGEGVAIERERKDGVTTYHIA